MKNYIDSANVKGSYLLVKCTQIHTDESNNTFLKLL